LEEIIKTLKTQYPRDVRKQLVKSILQNEKDNVLQATEQQYIIMGQIFSYVLKELNWTMPTNSNEVDMKPLKIMEEVFPKIETTKWYKNQILTAKKNIGLKID
jgi:hypothetical protein